MRTSTYLFKQGYDNLRKHGSKTFSTMLIICATMVILGIFIILLQNVNKNVKTVREEQGFQAFISDELNEEGIEYIKDNITIIPGIKDINYIDKDEAFEDAKNVFKGQEYLLEGLEKVKPFPASFVITFHDINEAPSIKEQVEKIEGITKVKYNESTIGAVITISNIANVFLLSIGIVMLIISTFIISNTIKLAVYSNKREIYIMKYIGATNSFIRKPFIVEGAIMGILSALISFIVISIGYVIIYARLPQFGTSLGVFGFIPYSQLWYFVLTVFLVVGLFVGIVGSIISIRKYLKV